MRNTVFLFAHVCVCVFSNVECCEVYTKVQLQMQNFQLSLVGTKIHTGEVTKCLLKQKQKIVTKISFKAAKVFPNIQKYFNNINNLVCIHTTCS